MATNCTTIQQSLAWCQGTPELPGIKRRIYYIGKDQIVKWPTLNHDTRGRLVTAAYAGNFVLAADANWKYIDILPDKSQLTSEAQGEYPSMTQLNKLTAVHPGVGMEASALAAYVNNNDCVFLVETVRGKYRVVGSEAWQVKSTVAQDLGQGPTGTTSTTLSVEATDECPAPVYFGKIVTDCECVYLLRCTGGTEEARLALLGEIFSEKSGFIMISPCALLRAMAFRACVSSVT